MFSLSSLQNHRLALKTGLPGSVITPADPAEHRLQKPKKKKQLVLVFVGEKTPDTASFFHAQQNGVKKERKARTAGRTATCVYLAM